MLTFILTLEVSEYLHKPTIIPRTVILSQSRRTHFYCHRKTVASSSCEESVGKRARRKAYGKHAWTSNTVFADLSVDFRRFAFDNQCRCSAFLRGLSAYAQYVCTTWVDHLSRVVTSLMDKLQKDERNRGTFTGHGERPTENMPKAAILFLQILLRIFADSTLTTSADALLPFVGYRRTHSMGGLPVEGSDVIGERTTKGCTQQRHLHRARLMAYGNHA